MDVPLSTEVAQLMFKTPGRHAGSNVGGCEAIDAFF